MGATPVGKLGILLFHKSPEAVIALTKNDPSQVFFFYILTSFFSSLRDHTIKNCNRFVPNFNVEIFEPLFLAKFLVKSCARDRKNESRLPVASFLSTNKKKISIVGLNRFFRFLRSFYVSLQKTIDLGMTI